MSVSGSRGEPVLNGVSVDVEEHFQVSAFDDTVRREDWERAPSRVVNNTSRLLDLFDEAGVQATFFVLGWVAERQGELVKEIARRGHELASHGYSHRLIYSQSPGEFRQELQRSKSLLEDLTGQAVRGHRGASFSIRWDNLWALDIIAELGFSYDSTLFPVSHHDRYGIPGAPRGLYRAETAAGRRIVEVPPSTLALGRWTLPVAGGGYLRILPRALTHWALKRLNERERRPVIVYLHPWEIDPEQPRVRDLPRFSAFRHYTNLKGMAERLRELLGRGRFSTLNQVIEQAGELDVVRLDGRSDRAG